jgi:glycosyltransferase involved in cell wall biosynthesis
MKIREKIGSSVPRILHVIDHTSYGGAQVVVNYLIRSLRQQFFFAVAVLGDSGIYSEAYLNSGVPVYQLASKFGRWDPSAILGLISKIRSEDFNLVHTHLFKSHILGAFAARMTGRKTIIQDHSSLSPNALKYYFPSKFWGRLYLSTYRFALNLSDRVIVLNPNAEREYNENYSLANGKLKVLPNGIDWSESSPNRDYSGDRSIRANLNLSENAKLVMMAGRLEPKKDWWTFLKVAEKTRDRVKGELVFLIAGSGSEEDKIQNYIRDRGLDFIRLLGFRQDLPALFSQVDVFMLTSLYEPFGIVILEAMAAGCAVVATRTEGAQSIITHGYDGLLAHIGNVEELSNHVNSLLTDGKLRQDLVNNGSKTVRDNYSVDKIAPKMAEIYRELLAGDGAEIQIDCVT